MHYRAPTLAPGPGPSLPRRLAGQMGLHGLWALTLLMAAWAGDMPDGPGASWLMDSARLHGWRLWAIWLAPTGLLLPALAGEWLGFRALSLAVLPAKAGSLPLLHNYRRWQGLTFAAWPVTLVAVGWHASLGDALLVLAGAYLLCLAGRTLALIALTRAGATFLEEVGAGAGRVDNYICVAVGLGSTVVFAALALWTSQAISTAGDEPLYLINVHRALAGLGLAEGQASAPAVRDAFYWGRWSPSLAHEWARAPLFIWLLAPGYLLAGRLGGLIMLAILGGLTLALVTRLARGLGYGSRESLSAAWVLGLSPPFLLLTQHIYPDLLAVLAVAASLLLLLDPAGRPLLRLAAVAGMAVIIVLIKLRFVPVAGALVLLAGLRLWGPRLSKKTWLLVAGCVAGVLILAWATLHLLGYPLPYLLRFMGTPGQFTPGPMAAVLPALLLDQEYGLLFLAPWTILALAGGAFLIKRLPWVGASALVLGLAVFVPVLIWRWIQWDGGYTPAARYLSPLFPLLAVFALPALACRGSHPFRIWAWMLVTLSGLWSLLICLTPLWRYQRRIGAANLWAWLGEQTGTHLERFFPSFVSFFAPDMLKALPWLGLVALTTLALWRGRRSLRCHAPAASGKIIAACAACLILLAAGGLLWAGKKIPTAHFQAESMHRQGAILYGTYYPQVRYLLLRRQGDLAGKTIIWGQGSTQLDLWGLSVFVSKTGQAPGGPLPVLAIDIDGKQVATLSPKWQVYRHYTIPLSLSPGPHRLSLRMAAQTGRSQIAVDRLEVR